MLTTIEADLIPCAVELIAFPGDKLICVGGTCVGVQTAQAKLPAATRPFRQRFPRDHTQLNYDNILKLLSTPDGLTTRELGNKLGLDAKARGVLASWMTTQTKRAVLQIVPGHESERYPPYRLAPKALNGTANQGDL